MSAELFKRNGLSLERLDTLCTIASKGLISRAAHERGSKQSQFSRQLKDLEGFFRTKLLDRRTKGLTDAGKRLVALTGPFITGLANFAAELSGFRTVSIGAGQAIIDWVLLPRFAELYTGLPRMNWAMENLTSTAIKERLLDLTLDLGILRKEACGGEKALQTCSFFSMNFALFVPSLLRQRRSIPTATLSGSAQFTSLFERIARSLNPPHEIVLSCNSFPSIKQIVASSSLAGPVPLIAAKDLLQPDFEMIKRPAFDKLTREYVLAVNRKNLQVQPEIESIRDRLVNLCSVQG